MSLVGGHKPNTFMKWVWIVFQSIADGYANVVRVSCIFQFYAFLIFLMPLYALSQYCRSDGNIDLIITEGRCVL
jgi:hypothetical protein